MFVLYDTRTGQPEPVTGWRRGELRMHTCGPTVYRRAHIGDLRSYFLSDLVRRTAELGGRQVTACQDINDIGHPFGAAAGGAAGQGPLAAGSAREIALYHEDAFRADLSTLNIRPAEHSPRASESVPVVIEMISKLMEGGNAYGAGDGWVFFDVRSFPGYGELSGRGGGEVRAAAEPRSGTGPRRFHQDWVLWKPAAAGVEPAWESPWGMGLPGWHAGCSAISLHHLGDVIDVHTGGIDLRFPHHENKRAISNAAAGHEVVQRWVYGAGVRFDGRDMTTSGTGAVPLSELTGRGLDPLALRLAFLDHHYRQEIELGWAVIEAADRTLRRWRGKVAAWSWEPSAPMARRYVERLLAAIAGDLDTPAVMRMLGDLEADGSVAPGAKFETFSHLDRLLALDLARDVGKPGTQAPADGMEPD